MGEKLEFGQNRVGPVLVEHRPRLLSDNGSGYLSKDLNVFLERKHTGYTRGASYRAMAQAKIERWHRLMKNSVNLQNYFLSGELEIEIASWVKYSNRQRYPESQGKLTPADMYFGRTKAMLNQRAGIKKRMRQHRRLQNLQTAAV